MIWKWVSRIVTSLFVLLLVLMLFTTVSSRLSGDGAPRVFGKEILSVLSGSMEPGIKTGSVIAVTPIKNPLGQTFQKGDVITFKAVDNPNMLITHRIVDIQGQGTTLKYVTKGDNNDAQDPQPVPAGHVVAQYANFTIPLLGYILAWVKTKVGIAIMLFLPGIILILQPLISLYKTLSKEEDDAEQKGDANSNATPTNG